MSDTRHTGPAGQGRLVKLADGRVTIERDGERVDHVFWQGCRAAYLGSDPDNPGRMVIAVEGGARDRAGIDTDCVVFSISPAGLDALIGQLRIDLQKHLDGRAIDMRFLV